MKKKHVVIALAVFLAAFVAYTLWMHCHYPVLFIKGDFVDIFAGIGAFFSGLAFLGVIFTLLLQQQELSLQRTELKKTTEIQTKQAESLRISAKLSGLSALLVHNNVLLEMARAGNPMTYRTIKNDADTLITQIKEITDSN